MATVGEKWLTGCALTACVGALNACVVGIENRPTRQQIVEGPPPPPPERVTAMGLITASVVGVPPATSAPAAKQKRSAKQVRVAGYYHWDGVRYVWTEEQFEDEHLPFRWQPQEPE